MQFEAKHIHKNLSATKCPYFHTQFLPWPMSYVFIALLLHPQ